MILTKHLPVSADADSLTGTRILMVSQTVMMSVRALMMPMILMAMVRLMPVTVI